MTLMLLLLGVLVVMRALSGVKQDVTELRGEIHTMLPRLTRLGVLQDQTPLSALKGALSDVVDLLALISSDELEHTQRLAEIREISEVGTAAKNLMDYKTKLVEEVVKLQSRKHG